MQLVSRRILPAALPWSARQIGVSFPDARQLPFLADFSGQIIKKRNPPAHAGHHADSAGGPLLTAVCRNLPFFRIPSAMPSLTHWLQRFVDEVRAPFPASATAAVLDQSLAAAFVHLPTERPAPEPVAIAGDPLFGPTPAIPSRGASTPSPWSSSQRPTPSVNHLPWPSGAHARPTAESRSSLVAPPPPPSSARAFAALASAFSNPRSVPRAPSPGLSPHAWPTASRTGPGDAPSPLSPRVATSPPDPTGHSQTVDSATVAGESAPPHAPTPAPAVIPLAELLRDLAPASPIEARLEALWQQRSGTFSHSPGGWPEAVGGAAATPPPAVDWTDLARRLADLEAGQVG